MNVHKESLVRRALKEQHGQVLPWVAFMMLMFLGMAAFVLDIGHAFYCYKELQAATDAAALAGAEQLDATNAVATATAYSAVTGGKNTNPNLSLNGVASVSMVPGYPVLSCLATVTSMGVPCTAPTNSNAIVVKQQAVVNTFFAQVFGIKQMTLSATATAAVAGASAIPKNVVILLDTTASMTTVDSNCLVSGGSAERIVCAESGVADLLQNLPPCNLVQGCGTVTAGVAANPLVQVAIFTFPNITVGTASDDYNCSRTSPTVPVYSFPPVGGSTYAPSGSSTTTYEVVPFQSNFKTSDTVSVLNAASDLAMVVGSGTKSGSSCPGMAAPGGDGTYYAGAIYAAQAALTAQLATEMASNPPVTPQNWMIILSDGEANASSSKMATKTTGGTTVNTSNPWPSSGGGATSSISNYPSAIDQCQQAVAAANYAKGQGTIVVTVAYGSESSGCTSDTTGPQPNISPCSVMSEMASSPADFYSDYLQSGSGSSCVSAGEPETSMAGIFGKISESFLNARLIPNGST
jgi:Putative Flp pilus-assembly TadE/G-like